MRNKIFFLVITSILISRNTYSQEMGTYTDPRDGKVYETVIIGNQTWMAENLAYKLSKGCWAFNNDQNNVKTFGLLYDWESAKKACPPGWHLPTDTEWTELTDFVEAMKDSLFHGYYYVAKKMKATTEWEMDTNGTNDSGFTGLPGGTCDENGRGSSIGINGVWWSSTMCMGEFAYTRRMTSYQSQYEVNATNFVLREYYFTKYGLSVRCIMD
jgi:uncharacterized protein (TIGR02145 family)